MPRPEKTTRQKPHKARRAGPNKSRTIYVTLLFIGLLIVAVVGTYRLYHNAQPKQIPLSRVPAYETYVSHGTEEKIKELDRCIGDVLLTLKVPPENVVFKSVEIKRDQEEEWTYSDLEVTMLQPVSLEYMQAYFFRELGNVIPKEPPRFILESDHEPVLEITVNGRRTHRITFLAPKEEGPPPVPSPTLPRVAIIIDDLGYDQKIASKFLEIKGLLSFSVLPHSPFQDRIATAIHEGGRDVLLHLPMEPLEYPHVNPGGGALMSSMSPEELINELNQDLDSVPFVIGVNNHMGSKLTQDSAKMHQILSILKERNLFFIDSLTSPKSSCAEVASVLKLRFARRHVFLDNTQDANAIRFQFKRLVSVAKKQGQAIGIAHPHSITWEVLKEELPKITHEIQLVRVSELL